MKAALALTGALLSLSLPALADRGGSSSQVSKDSGASAALTKDAGGSLAGAAHAPKAAEGFDAPARRTPAGNAAPHRVPNPRVRPVPPVRNVPPAHRGPRIRPIPERIALEERPLPEHGRKSARVSTAASSQSLSKMSPDLLSSTSAPRQGAGRSASGASSENRAVPGLSLYGHGHSGYHGVPKISFIGETAPGSTVTILVQNSSGQDGAQGYLLVGTSETAVPSPTGGTVLCSGDVLFSRIRLSPGLNSFSVELPSDLDVDAVCVQVIMRDGGARGGWSMTRGLRIALD